MTLVLPRDCLFSFQLPCCWVFKDTTPKFYLIVGVLLRTYSYFPCLLYCWWRCYLTLLLLWCRLLFPSVHSFVAFERCDATAPERHHSWTLVLLTVNWLYPFLPLLNWCLVTNTTLLPARYRLIVNPVVDYWYCYGDRWPCRYSIRW